MSDYELMKDLFKPPPVECMMIRTKTGYNINGTFYTDDELEKRSMWLMERRHRINLRIAVLNDPTTKEDIDAVRSDIEKEMLESVYDPLENA